jgi:antitoxin ParD1/3/4
MTDMTISVSPALKQWIDERVALGEYADAADYVRDLLRRDQEQAADEAQWLKEMIDEGRASGRLNQNPKNVLREIMTEYPANRG